MDVCVEYVDMCVPFRISVEVRKFVRDHKERDFGGEEIQCDGKEGEANGAKRVM